MSRLQRSAGGVLLSLRSWASHLLRGPPGQRPLRSGGWSNDTSTSELTCLRQVWLGGRRVSSSDEWLTLQHWPKTSDVCVADEFYLYRYVESTFVVHYVMWIYPGATKTTYRWIIFCVDFFFFLYLDDLHVTQRVHNDLQQTAVGHSAVEIFD